ncbi:hypothetical protein MRX96_014381 [Rhipicephalus microplus]
MAALVTGPHRIKRRRGKGIDGEQEDRLAEVAEGFRGKTMRFLRPIGVRRPRRTTLPVGSASVSWPCLLAVRATTAVLSVWRGCNKNKLDRRWR